MDDHVTIKLWWPCILLQPQAKEKAEKEGFNISIAKTSFKANTKALAENEAEGLAKVKNHIPLVHDAVLKFYIAVYNPNPSQSEVYFNS